MDNTTLEHHGIKGQKWGVRRYQNKDGSLTPAGKKRVAKLQEEYSSLTGKKPGSDKSSSAKTSSSKNEQKKETEEPKRKSVKEMSDAELNAAVNRLRLEQQYSQLSPKEISAGKAFANKVFKDVLVPVATDVAKQALTKQLKKALDLSDNNGGKKKDKKK